MTKVQTAIMDIFKTDTKTTKYLSKRFELSEDEFLAAAAKQRPKNVKLKEYILSLEDNSEEEKEEKCRGDKFLLEACEIFKNDKGTIKRIMRGVDSNMEVLDILWSAASARPKNKKIKSLIDAYEILKEKNEREADKVIEEDKIKKDFEESSTIDYDSNEYIKIIFDIFKNDKGTLSKVRSAIRRGDGINIICSIVSKARPANVRYGKFYKGTGNELIFDKEKYTNTVPKDPEDVNKGTKSYANTAGAIESEKVVELTDDELKEINLEKMRIAKAKQKDIDEANAARDAEQSKRDAEVASESENDESDESINSAVAYRPSFKHYNRKNTYKNEPRYDSPTSDDKEDYSDLVDEFSFTRDDGKYDNVTVTESMSLINVIDSLRDIFSKDKGTLRAIEKKIAAEVLDDDLLEYALAKRPKNAKLKKLIEEVSKESIVIEDAEDDAELNTVYDGEGNEDNKYAAYADMKVDSIPFVENVGQNVTMYLNGEMEVINNEHSNFNRIVLALNEERWNDVFPLLDLRGAISKLVYKQLTFDGDKLFHKGEELDGALIDFIIEMVKAGNDDIQPFMRFLNKVQKNPSIRSQKELYGFLRSGKIPITPSGNILTYKRIRSNWKDCHSNTMDNSLGNVVRMNRLSVDNNSNNTCSTGLHVCSYSYLGSFSGDRIVICEVHPRDVVSIPTDYNNAKMRCCKYKVIKEVKNNTEDVLALNPIYFG